MKLLGLEELRAPGMLAGIAILVVLYIAVLIFIVLIRSRENEDMDKGESDEEQRGIHGRDGMGSN